MMDVVQALPAQTGASSFQSMESVQVNLQSNSVQEKGVDHLARVIPQQVAGDGGLENFPPLPSRVTDSVSKKGKNAGENKSWSELFKDNRAPSQSTLLDDTSPNDRTGCCFLEDDDLLPTREVWGHTLIGYFAGKFPGRWGVNNLVKNWKVPVIHHFHESGWIVFQFQDENSMSNVLEGGPHFAAQAPLLLKPIPELFKFNDEVMKSMPVWVTLPCLPKECWGKKGLSKIVSQLGKPLRMDRRTSTLNAVSYARALVIVDASKDLLKEVSISVKGRESFVQKIHYDYHPKYCTICKCIGHKNANCHRSDVPGIMVGNASTNMPAKVDSVFVKVNSLHHKGSNSSNKTIGDDRENEVMKKGMEGNGIGNADKYAVGNAARLNSVGNEGSHCVEQYVEDGDAVLLRMDSTSVKCDKNAELAESIESVVLDDIIVKDLNVHSVNLKSLSDDVSVSIPCCTNSQTHSASTINIPSPKICQASQLASHPTSPATIPINILIPQPPCLSQYTASCIETDQAKIPRKHSPIPVTNPEPSRKKETKLRKRANQSLKQKVGGSLPPITQ